MSTMVREWLSAPLKYSSRFWYFAGCYFASTLFMLFQGGKLAFMIFFIMTLLTAYLVLGRWSGIARATGSRTLLNIESDRAIEAGSSVAIKLQLHVPGFWPIPYVVIRDRLLRRGGAQSIFETSCVPDWKRRGTVEYVTQPLRRGFYHFAETECSTEDIFGMFEHSGLLAMQQSFVVKPQTIAIKEWQQFHQAFKGHHYHSTTTQALRETTQINGVREYIYGDRISRIHWNATAKSGTWKSKEFERESLPKSVVMIDRNADNYESREMFELAVSVGASLLEYGMQKDLAMGLLSVGSNAVYLEPNRMSAHYRRMNQHLIDIEADGSYSLLDILKDRARYFSQGCFFLVISSQMDDRMAQSLQWINHRQMNPCHILIGTAGRTAAAEEWLRKLRNRGMLAYAVNTLMELPGVLGGKRR